jgi:hypothetical protein
MVGTSPVPSRVLTDALWVIESGRDNWSCADGTLGSEGHGYADPGAAAAP